MKIQRIKNVITFHYFGAQMLKKGTVSKMSSFLVRTFSHLLSFCGTPIINEMRKKRKTVFKNKNRGFLIKVVH